MQFYQVEAPDAILDFEFYNFDNLKEILSFFTINYYTFNSLATCTGL
jgi:hypothetical protein